MQKSYASSFFGIFVANFVEKSSHSAKIPTIASQPVVGQGPFVMNSRAEIQKAFEDFQLSRMGDIE